MDLITLVLDFMVLLLSIYSLNMVWSFYTKFKVKLMSILFASFVVVWIIKALIRIFINFDIMVEEDILALSAAGVTQIILFLILFRYILKNTEKYL